MNIYKFSSLKGLKAASIWLFSLPNGPLERVYMVAVLSLKIFRFLIEILFTWLSVLLMEIYWAYPDFALLNVHRTWLLLESDQFDSSGFFDLQADAKEHQDHREAVEDVGGLINARHPYPLVAKVYQDWEQVV
jgi:hypothetical protein